LHFGLLGIKSPWAAAYGAAVNPVTTHNLNRFLNVLTALGIIGMALAAWLMPPSLRLKLLGF
jgi:hypothetical protein